MLVGDDAAGEGAFELGRCFGAAELEDEVGLGGSVDELEVAPLLDGGVELVVADGGAAGDVVEEGVVGAGVGEEDFVGGGDARYNAGRRLLGGLGGRSCGVAEGKGGEAEGEGEIEGGDLAAEPAGVGGGAGDRDRRAHLDHLRGEQRPCE